MKETKLNSESPPPCPFSMSCSDPSLSIFNTPLLATPVLLLMELGNPTPVLPVALMQTRKHPWASYT
ncbi:hypothetical protein ACRRTK_012995 [Alexandromys fortis]